MSVYCIYTEGDRGTLMKIILKNNSDFPIYEQIKQQVKQNILKGHVAPGEHLPSMRELAKDLQVRSCSLTKVPFPLIVVTKPSFSKSS
jgi:GntR family transcriptional regulator